MTTKVKTKARGKKRYNITAEPELAEILEAIARRDGVPVTGKAHDLIWRALELEEDLAWEALAEARLKSNRGKWLTHEQVFGFK